MGDGRWDGIGVIPCRAVNRGGRGMMEEGGGGGGWGDGHVTVGRDGRSEEGEGDAQARKSEKCVRKGKRVQERGMSVGNGYFAHHTL